MLWCTVFVVVWALSLFFDAGFSRGREWVESGGSVAHLSGRGMYVRQIEHGVTLMACSYELSPDWNRGLGTGLDNSAWWRRRGSWWSSEPAWWFSFSLRDGYTVAWPGGATVTFAGWTLGATVPYWALVAGGLAVMLPLMVRRRRRLVRERTGKCLSCGYDRAGIAADVPCPECGRTV